MNQIATIVHKIPPGLDMVAVGALLAFGTKVSTVKWIAFGVGGLMFLLSMQKTAA